MKLSEKVLSLKKSPIRKLFPLARKAEERGTKVYYLNIGQPDLATPKVFLESVKKLEQDVISYAPTRGTEELLEAVKSYFRRNKIRVKKEDILITNGASEALHFAISITCDVDDEVLIPEPFYVNTSFFLNQLGVKKVVIPTKERHGYHLPRAEKIERLITPKTRAIIITNPNNPTGTVYSREEIETIKEVALKHNLFIIADEVYSKFVFKPSTHTSFGHLKGLENNLILVDSVSKRYSSCGARIGALVSRNKEFMEQAFKLASSRLSVSTLNQVGATALYNIEDSYFADTAKVYEKRRDAVLEELKKIPDISFNIPEGAFYLIVTLPFSNSGVFAKWLLNEFTYEGETVFVAPAKDFYHSEHRGKNQVRLAFIYEEDILRRAIKVFGEAIKAYPRESF